MPIAADTFSLFHVHPNASAPQPSDIDKAAADELYEARGEFLMFTFSSSGLYVYDPSDKSTTLLRNGLDWLNPCQ